mmetsp:Transcript_45149/g.107416  ORF Transcript_45149/g.107416 Transcript_45149/m.107416 type:complete len:822 (-) Transcript_45149:105-2570(-)
MAAKDEEKNGASLGTVSRNGEPTQRFSALQQQLLSAAIHFFHRHIRWDNDVLQRMEGNQMFRLFFEVQYHNNKADLNRIFPDSVHDCSALHVCSFILSILHQGIFSVSAFIVSVIYLSRFKESSHITLHACTWRPLFLTSLLLADKMWEDKPVRNSSLAKLFPVLNNRELNRMESEFLGEIRFNVLVKPDLFCSFCEKLLAEQVHAEISRCVSTSEFAATLQADEELAPPKPLGKLAPEAQQSQPAKLADTQTPSESEDGREAPSISSSVQPVRPAAARLGQVPGGWLETHDAGSVHSSDASGSRSHSAGPTACGGSRRDHPRVVADTRGQQVHPPSVVTLRAGGGTHKYPLNRSDSQKKPVVGGKVRTQYAEADEGSDKSGRAGGHVTMSCASMSQHGPPQRRSMPAKTSGAGYAPLARAPSTGSNLSGGTTVTGGGCGGPGSVVSGATSASSTAAPAGTPMAPLGTVIGAGGNPFGGARPPPQSSPRSPGSVSPKLHNHEPALRATQVTPPAGEPVYHGGCRAGCHPQVSQVGGTGRYTIGSIPSSSCGGCVTTPPVPMSGDASVVPPGTSMQVQQNLAKGPQPRGAPGHGLTGAQPLRALSAPRVSGVAAHNHGHSAQCGGGGGPGGSSNIRTSSQPMQATYARQEHHNFSSAPSPGSPTLGTTIVGGGQQSYSSSFQSTSAPSPQVPQPSAQVRGSSVQSTMSGNVAHGSVRGVISSAPCSSAATRNPSQSGAVSSTGVVPASQSTTMRGRSPAPAPAAAGMLNGGALPAGSRQPRAATPTSCIKGMVQHPQAPGMVGVPRGSFGNGPMVVPRGAYA